MLAARRNYLLFVGSACCGVFLKTSKQLFLVVPISEKLAPISGKFVFRCNSLSHSLITLSPDSCFQGCLLTLISHNINSCHIQQLSSYIGTCMCIASVSIGRKVSVFSLGLQLVNQCRTIFHANFHVRRRFSLWISQLLKMPW